MEGVTLPITSVLEELEKIETKAQEVLSLVEVVKGILTRLRVEEDRLKELRRELDEERAHFYKEQTAVAQQNSEVEDVIPLNVGGTVYITTKKTLCAIPDSLLSAWFSGRHHLVRNQKGEVIIDRNPTLFSIILDYLRTDGQHIQVPKDIAERQRLQEEFDYFLLPWPYEVIDRAKAHTLQSINVGSGGSIRDMFIDGYETLQLDTETASFDVKAWVLDRGHLCGRTETGVRVWNVRSGELMCSWRPRVETREDHSKIVRFDYPNIAIMKTRTAVLIYNVEREMEVREIEVPSAMYDYMLAATTLFVHYYDNEQNDFCVAGFNIATGTQLWITAVSCNVTMTVLSNFLSVMPCWGARWCKLLDLTIGNVVLEVETSPGGGDISSVITDVTVSDSMLVVLCRSMTSKMWAWHIETGEPLATGVEMPLDGTTLASNVIRSGDVRNFCFLSRFMDKFSMLEVAPTSNCLLEMKLSEAMMVERDTIGVQGSLALSCYVTYDMLVTFHNGGKVVAYYAKEQKGTKRRRVE